ncbi:DUF1415 domain-containing protein [Thiomonas bhubaneswarensis]|uniref:DUF1415 domain-containing protein n=1 Tax=Thiomonas bhubaneswarensis TaxID=339866 RepID=A0A0K6I6X0_9BURK|nr:DUF1415 domain-containing protein [Thiomonas bhubaneswarensis]CUA98836.1 Uncharacterized protein Ga0061069_10850 [Thiomonas bhubaneswarensis]
MTGVATSEDAVVAQTRAWVDRLVIGLNLCPFARAPQVKGRIRYVHSTAATPEDLLHALGDELRLLAGIAPEEVETTLLIHPKTLTHFAHYNAFLDEAEALLVRLELLGTLQIASFHPHYRFSGTRPDDVTNATNRSPFPMLHLIRESSIDRAVAAFADTASIYRTNQATMRRLGKQGVAALLAECRETGR